MEIILNNDLLQVSALVQSKAKYQKVMLLFDDYSTSEELYNIYLSIKDLCVFNKMHINQINETELLNGYKLIIYCCVGTSLINLNFNREEFINIYLLKDTNYLPCYVNNNSKIISNGFLFAEKPSIDFNLLNSYYFNNFINYIESVLKLTVNNFENCLTKEINANKIFDIYTKLNNNYSFMDISIIKFCKMDTKNLCLVHLVVIDAFLIFITNLKNKQIDLVDFYKATKNNLELVDKFYALFNNNEIYNGIVLNYNQILNATIKTKTTLLENISLYYQYNINDLNETINNVKEYSKQSNNLLSYLYLFNIFGN